MSGKRLDNLNDWYGKSGCEVLAVVGDSRSIKKIAVSSLAEHSSHGCSRGKSVE